MEGSATGLESSVIGSTSVVPPVGMAVSPVFRRTAPSVLLHSVVVAKNNWRCSSLSIPAPVVGSVSASALTMSGASSSVGVTVKHYATSHRVGGSSTTGSGSSVSSGWTRLTLLTSCVFDIICGDMVIPPSSGAPLGTVLSRRVFASVGATISLVSLGNLSGGSASGSVPAPGTATLSSATVSARDVVCSNE